MDRPLPTLLSQVYVAFTIELDNEFEHRMPHRTTKNGSTETAWRERFGDKRINALREPPERLADDPALFRGLRPYPDGWRASAREPRILPHCPMVLHRGGYPDGS